jgi:hypothetical protein
MGSGPSALNLLSQRNVEREPLPFHAGVESEHTVGSVCHGHTRREGPGGEGVNAVGIEQGCVFRIALIEILKTIFS